MRFTRFLALAGALVGLALWQYPVEAAAPLSSRIVVSATGTGIPTVADSTIDDRLRKSLETYRRRTTSCGAAWLSRPRMGVPAANC